MSEGYINSHGEWVDGEPPAGSYSGIFGRSIVSSAHNDFPERLVSSRPRMLWQELSKASIIADHLPDEDDVEIFVRQAISGGRSYFEDLGWYGYGLLALSGAIGPTQQNHVLETMRVVEHAVVNTLFKGDRRGYKLCFAVSMWLNYTLHYGAGEFIGRYLTGLAFNSSIQHFVGIPARLAWNVHGLALGLAASWGGIIRTADKFRDQYGSLDDLTALDIMIVAINGHADPRQLRRNKQNMKDAFVNRLEDIADSLEDLGTRTTFEAIMGEEWQIFDYQVRGHARRFKEFAYRLDNLPATNLLENGDDFYFLIVDIKQEIDVFYRSNNLIEHLPEDVRDSVLFIDNLFNPRICEFVMPYFEIMAKAFDASLQITVSATKLQPLVIMLNSANGENN